MIAHVSLWQLNNGQVYLDLCLSILISMSCLSHTLMEEFLDLLTNLIMITEWFKAVSSGQTKQSLWLINYASIAWVTNGCICSQDNKKAFLKLVLSIDSWAFSIFSIVGYKATIYYISGHPWWRPTCNDVWRRRLPGAADINYFDSVFPWSN